MKNLKFLLLMLAAVLCPTLYAQTPYDYELDEDNPMITEVEQLSSPWSCGHAFEGNISHLIDGDPLTYWHTNWNDHSHRHYVQVALNEPAHGLVSMQFTRRKYQYNSTTPCVKDHVTKWGIYGADEPDAEEADWELLLEAETPYTTPGETMNTIGFDMKDKMYIRVYGEETSSNDRYWHCAELNFYPCHLATEMAAALKELENVYHNYEGYAEDFENHVGTAPGQYSEEAVAAFVDALNKANDMVDGTGTFTADDVKALSETIKTTYQAVLDSLVPFTLADGYYRIRCGLAAFAEPKYMYSVEENGSIYARWNTPEDIENDCPSLWKVTNVDGGLFDIVSMATMSRFNDVARSAAETMSPQSQNLIAADLWGNVDGTPFVNLRVSTQAGNDYLYLHGAGHSNGEGVAGNIVGWCKDPSTPSASEWTFEPVDEAKVQEILEAWGPYKEHAQLVENFISLRDEAERKLEVAKDIHFKDPLITKVSQLSSPWSAPHAYEGNLAHLIDGDPLTYWHTNWNNNTDPQYVQVALKDAVHELICMRFTRRLYNYNSTTVLNEQNHVTYWSIQGSNDPTADDSDWEPLAEFDTPYNEPGETYVTDGFDTKGLKYLRIYGDENNSGNKYWHVAELRLYPSPLEVVDSPTSQYHIMGSIATNLENALTPLLDIDPQTITQSEYDALLAAYEAFDAVYVDPAPLRAKILDVEDATAIIAYGTDPGFWASDNQAANELAKAIADAQAYDEGGQYTSSESEAQMANLEAKAAGIKGAANPIQGGKWYRIRFGTEEEYNEHAWNKNGNETDYRKVNGEVTDVVINESLFGKCLTIAELERVPNEDEAGTFNCNVIRPMAKDDVSLEHCTYCDAKEDIENPDLALWRFIPVGDNEFYIQNKATGLYLQKKVENNDGLVVGLHPSIFSQEVAGYGQNALFIKTLNGEQQNPMHFARNTNVAITYGNWGDSDGRRGCFFIEAVDDVASDYAQNEAKMSVWSGAMITRCYPISLKASSESDGVMYTVSSVKTEDNVVEVTLQPMANNEAGAGCPFIYIKNGAYTPADERSDDDEPELVPVTFGYEIVTEPKNDGALKGVFTRTNVGSGVLLVGEAAITAADNDININTDRAYISSDEESFSSSQTFEILFNDTPWDGVNSVLQKVAQEGEIYTLDGRRVGKGNINSLRGAQPGIYVVGGVKVIVK